MRQPGPQRHTSGRQELRRCHLVGGVSGAAVGRDGCGGRLRVGLRADDRAEEHIDLGHRVADDAAHLRQPRLGEVARRLAVDDDLRPAEPCDVDLAGVVHAPARAGAGLDEQRISRTGAE